MKVKNFNSHIEHMINGYKQQQQYYRQLLELSQQLPDLVAENGLDKVQEVLLKKDDLIKNIREIDQNILQHKEAVMNLGQDQIYVDLRKELDEQRMVMQQTIQAIIETDRKNEAALENLKQEMARELRGIQQHYDLHQIYFDRPEKHPEPRFFDKKK